MKTLYIQITSAPAPEESANLVVYPADMSNYFCNYLEYEFVDGLQMPDGTPCYKEMKPGSLLLAFASEREEAYQSILRQWENIQRDLLREAPAPDTRYEVTLPKEYIVYLSKGRGETFRAKLALPLRRGFVRGNHHPDDEGNAVLLASA